MRLAVLLISLIFTSPALATLTICASGCNVTTLANALATATTTPNSVIQVNDNSLTNTTQTFAAVNTSLTLQGTSGPTTIARTGSGAMFSIAVGLASPLTIRNLILSKTTSAANIITWTNLGVGSSFYFSGVTFIQSTDADSIQANKIFITAGQLTLANCFFDSPGITTATNGSLALAALDITTGSVVATNCIFRCTLGNAYVDRTSVSTNAVVNFDHCSFVDSATGFTSKSAETVTNCLFTGNTTDLALTAPATFTEFTNSGFGQQASGGTGCIFGLTTASTYTDKNNNYWIGPQSGACNGGVTAGATGSFGLNGVRIGANSMNGMGPNQYSPSLCGGYNAGR